MHSLFVAFEFASKGLNRTVPGSNEGGPFEAALGLILLCGARSDVGGSLSL